MSTVAASGASSSASGAADAAARGLAGRAATFGLVFASSKHRLEHAMGAVREVAGGAELIGCSTAGEITERGLMHEGVVVMLVASDELVIDAQFVASISDAPQAAVEGLCAGYTAAGQKARALGYLDSTTVALLDGLGGVGEKVVAGVVRSTRAYQQVVGGAAGDEGQFKATWVARGARAATDAAVVLHAFGPIPWGVGVNHGLRAVTQKMKVTRAAGNVVYELDGKPAFEAYKRFARARGVELTASDAGSFLVNNELGVYFLSQLARARAPLSVGADGSLTLAAEIPEGASVSILGGTRDELVAAARAAAEEARDSLRGAKAAGVLLFDCICRGAILEEEFTREIEAVRAVFPETPIAGFLTYGEIARYGGKLDGWHNTTAVVVAIPTSG